MLEMSTQVNKSAIKGQQEISTSGAAVSAPVSAETGRVGTQQDAAGIALHGRRVGDLALCEVPTEGHEVAKSRAAIERRILARQSLQRQGLAAILTPRRASISGRMGATNWLPSGWLLPPRFPRKGRIDAPRVNIGEPIYLCKALAQAPLAPHGVCPHPGALGGTKSGAESTRLGAHADRKAQARPTGIPGTRLYAQGQVPSRKSTMMRAKNLLAATFGLCTAWAVAAPQTFDFSVDISRGPLSGSTYSGYFTANTSLLTSDPASFARVITDFSFNFNGELFDETTITTGIVYEDSGGNIGGIAFGTNCSPFTCTVTNRPAQTQWYFWSTAHFLYALPGGDLARSNEITLALRQSSLPEPGTAPLVIMACGLAIVLARRTAPSL